MKLLIAFLACILASARATCPAEGAPVPYFEVDGECWGGDRDIKYLHYIHCAYADLSQITPWVWFSKDGSTAEHAGKCEGIYPEDHMKMVDNVHGVVDIANNVELRMNFCDVRDSTANYDSGSFAGTATFSIPSVGATSAPEVCTNYNGDMFPSYTLDIRNNVHFKFDVCRDVANGGSWAGNFVLHAQVSNDESIASTDTCESHTDFSRLYNYRVYSYQPWTMYTDATEVTTSTTTSQAAATTTEYKPSRIGEFDYEHKLHMHDTYLLHWTVDDDEGVVHFGCEVKTVGWIGFGINDASQMAGADVIIASVDSTNGDAYFSDRMADDRVEPPLDTAPSDKVFHGGRWADGWMVIEFDWPITKSADVRDKGIAVGQQWVVFSHSNVYPFPLDAQTQQPTQALTQHTLAQPIRIELRPAPVSETCSSEVVRTRKYRIDQARINVYTFSGGVTVLHSTFGGKRSGSETVVEVRENADVEAGLDTIKTTQYDIAQVGTVRVRQGPSSESTESNIVDEPIDPPSTCPSGVIREGEMVLPMTGQTPDPQMRLRWAANCDTQEITFTLSGDCNGWLGVGFHHAGTSAEPVDVLPPYMAKADIYQVAVSNALAEVHDRHGPVDMNGNPTTDTQDAVLVGSVDGVEANGRTSVQFRRDFSTSDTNDVQFVPGERVHVIYSYNKNTDDINSYHTKAKKLDVLLDVFKDVPYTSTTIGPHTGTTTEGDPESTTTTGEVETTQTQMKVLTGAKFKSLNLHTADGSISANFRIADVAISLSADRDLNMRMIAKAHEVTGDVTITLHNFAGTYNVRADESNPQIIQTIREGESVMMYGERPREHYGAIGSGSDVLRVTHFGRGVVKIVAGEDVPLCSDANCEFVDFRFGDGWLPGKVEVKAKATSYPCWSWRLPAHIRGRYAVRMDPLIDQAEHAHHMLSWGGAPPAGALDGGACGMGGGLMFAWAVGAPAFILPTQASLPLDPIFEWFSISMHVDNPSTFAQRMDQSGYRIWFTDVPRANVAGQTWLGYLPPPMKPQQYTVYHAVPPGVSSYRTLNVCWLNGRIAPDQKLTVFAHLMHMHKSGRHGWSAIGKWHENVTSTWTTEEDTLSYFTGQLIGDPDHTFDFNLQQFDFLDEPIELDSESLVFTWCDWSTEGETEWTLPGDGTDQEMCIHSLMFYPFDAGFLSCNLVQTFQDNLHPADPNNPLPIDNYPPEFGGIPLFEDFFAQRKK